jgi:hypothetical protein
MGGAKLGGAKMGGNLKDSGVNDLTMKKGVAQQGLS